MTGENECHSYVFSFSLYTFQGVHGNIIIVYIFYSLINGSCVVTNFNFNHFGSSSLIAS